MTFELEANEVKLIIDALGELPTKSGAWVIGMKLDEQVKQQLPKEEPQE